jgi:hypothetical protein
VAANATSSNAPQRGDIKTCKRLLSRQFLDTLVP